MLLYHLIILVFFLYYAKKNCASLLPDSNGHYSHSSNLISQSSTLHESCEENQFRCGDGNCITMSNLCDGKNECLDNSDESQYCANRLCNPYQFKCGTGKCIPKHFVCNSENDCTDGSDESIDSKELLDPPNVTIKSELSILFGNSTYQYMKYEDQIRLKFICEANYPVEWIFNYENLVGNAMYERGNILELSPVTKSSQSLPYFRNDLNLFFKEVVGEDIFYCRGISHPCIQKMVVSLYNASSQQFQLKITEGANKKITSLFPPTIGDSQSSCNAIWYYESIKDYGAWRCTDSKGNPGEPVIINCESFNMCNNYFRNIRQPKHCGKFFNESEICPHCVKTQDNFHGGRIIECYLDDDNPRSYTLQVFNALRIKPNLASKIYFDLSDTPMEELLHLEEFPNDIFVGENNISITCRASAYYFQSDISIALEFVNGQLEFLYLGEEYREYKIYENEYVTTFQMMAFNETLERIYCIGQALTSLELTNTSRNIFIQIPAVRQSFSKNDETTHEVLKNDISHEWDNKTIELKYGGTGSSINCNVSGNPVPIITWSKDGNEILPTHEEIFENGSISQINFNKINESTAGVYKCEVINIDCNQTKYFEIIVTGNSDSQTGRHTTTIIGGVLVSCGVIALILSIVCYKLYRKKNKKPKRFGMSTLRVSQ